MCHCVIIHASSSRGVGTTISCIRVSACLLVCQIVCECVRVVKEKRLKPSTPKLAEITVINQHFWRGSVFQYDCTFIFFPDSQSFSQTCSSFHMFSQAVKYRSASISFVHTSFGTAPRIWNFLPPALHMCNDPDTFRHHLRPSCASDPASPDHCERLQIAFPYLLTCLICCTTAVKMGKNPHCLCSVLFGFCDYQGSVRLGYRKFGSVYYKIARTVFLQLQ